MPKTPEERRKYHREHSRRHYWKNRDAINAKRRTAKHREYQREYQRRMRREKPAQYDGRYIQLKAHEAEAGRPRPDQCEVCGAADKKIHFDHSHQHGAFRGWLCVNCNMVLGLTHDDPNHLRQLIAYLERTKPLKGRRIIPPQLTLPV